MQTTQHKPADFLEVGKPYAMFTSGSNQIRQAIIEDHIIVDRGFTATSIYMVNSNGDKFMIVRPAKYDFSDSKGNRYTFVEVSE